MERDDNENGHSMFFFKLHQMCFVGINVAECLFECCHFRQNGGSKCLIFWDIFHIFLYMNLHVDNKEQKM